MSVTLHLHEVDHNTLNFNAHVVVGAFSGHTDFWAVSNDMNRFLQDLETLDRRLTGETSISCGWGEDVYFGLSVRPEGSTGKLQVLVEIAAPSDVGTMMHRLSTSFVLPEPNALSRFNKARGRR